MIELYEEMKNHELQYVYFHRNVFKVQLASGEEIQASSARLLTVILKAISLSGDKS